MIVKKKSAHSHRWMATPLYVVLLSCSFANPALGQRPQIGLQGQIRPLSMAHLYRTFLNYQNHLDMKAAELQAQGKNGNLMRNYLQGRLGYSDADFVPIRTSSVRLTSKIKALDSQAAAIIAGGPSSSSHTQLQTLTVQRETYIAAEVSYLKQALPPDKIAALEAFMTQFFSPANAVPRPQPLAGQTAPAAVHP